MATVEKCSSEEILSFKQLHSSPPASSSISSSSHSRHPLHHAGGGLWLSSNSLSTSTTPGTANSPHNNNHAPYSRGASVGNNTNNSSSRMTVDSSIRSLASLDETRALRDFDFAPLFQPITASTSETEQGNFQVYYPRAHLTGGGSATTINTTNSNSSYNNSHSNGRKQLNHSISVIIPETSEYSLNQYADGSGEGSLVNSSGCSGGIPGMMSSGAGTTGGGHLIKQETLNRHASESQITGLADLSFRGCLKKVDSVEDLTKIKSMEKLLEVGGEDDDDEPGALRHAENIEDLSNILQSSQESILISQSNESLVTMCCGTSTTSSDPQYQHYQQHLHHQHQQQHQQEQDPNTSGSTEEIFYILGMGGLGNGFSLGPLRARHKSSDSSLATTTTTGSLGAVGAPAPNASPGVSAGASGDSNSAGRSRSLNNAKRLNSDKYQQTTSICSLDRVSSDGSSQNVGRGK